MFLSLAGVPDHEVSSQSRMLRPMRSGILDLSPPRIGPAKTGRADIPGLHCLRLRTWVPFQGLFCNDSHSGDFDNFTAGLYLVLARIFTSNLVTVINSWSFVSGGRIGGGGEGQTQKFPSHRFPFPFLTISPSDVWTSCECATVAPLRPPLKTRLCLFLSIALLSRHKLDAKNWTV